MTKAADYVDYGARSVQPLGCADDVQGRRFCVIGECKPLMNTPRITFKFKGKSVKTRWF